MPATLLPHPRHPVRVYRYSSPSLRHLAWCLRLIVSNDDHPTFISIFLDMLFTKFIVTLALLSVGYAQPVPSCECFGFRTSAVVHEVLTTSGSLFAVRLLG